MAHDLPTLAVLAGGQGSRMKMPKSRLTLHGQPILRYLLERSGWIGRGPTLLVTSPGLDRPPGYDRFDAEAVDSVPGEGPLRGLLTALTYATTERIIAVTVDMPGLEFQHLQWLLNEGTMCSRRVDGQDVIEPFPCVIGQELKTAILRRLHEGRRSVQSLVEEPEVRVVPAPAASPARVWTNQNHPEDMQAFEREGDDATGKP
jgi:molybdopterin-guanine dinucleotide biosynthesis protein A